MVPERDVIWPFRIFAFILPMRWTLSSMVLLPHQRAMPCAVLTYYMLLPYRAMQCLSQCLVLTWCVLLL